MIELFEPDTLVTSLILKLLLAVYFLTTKIIILLTQLMVCLSVCLFSFQIRLKEEEELEREWERRRVTEARAGMILDSQLAKKRKQLTKQLAEENRQLADEQRAR